MNKTPSYTAFYDSKYAEGEEIPRTSKIYTLESVPGDIGKSVLDVGCGAGLNSQWLADRGFGVQGLDISENAIKRYTERGFEGRVADIEQRLDYTDSSFDIVFCSEVIEHLVQPSDLLDEFCRIIRPGGAVVISVPNSAFWLYRLFAVFGVTLSDVQHPMHLRFFSKKSLGKLLIEAGFRPRQSLGRNMYAILPDFDNRLWHGLMTALGFKKEIRFRTKSAFWHLSHKSRTFNALFADTLIVTAERPEG